MRATHAPCLRRLREASEPSVRLVCFPWCGAGAGVFGRLARFIPGTADALAVQLPGREDRYKEPPYRRMADIVDHVTDALAVCSELPLVLFGHSMGALVAHEVAHRLRTRMGREPALLVVSGQDAPAAPAPDAPPWHEVDDLQLVAHLQALGGTPQALLDDPGARKALLPAVRADYAALASHAPIAGRALDCAVVACAAHDDSHVSAAGMAAWAAATRGPAEWHGFSGGHFYLCHAPEAFVGSLFEWIDKYTPDRRPAEGVR